MASDRRRRNSWEIARKGVRDRNDRSLSYLRTRSRPNQADGESPLASPSTSEAADSPSDVESEISQHDAVWRHFKDSSYDGDRILARLSQTGDC
ncbi:hypothetical protein L484_011756 [Morus notabilis]|uniref:Uncharacterized protein n=1 Tax=Morus notabilis TaxID=981085 RepID=W9RLI5_9ROSA|nr:hypothetical protein L484_011756 [Morus notabilis]